MAASGGTEPQTLVEVENLKTYFFLHDGTVRAVNGVSFAISEGRSLGVVGESGCGKSVTAQSMMRIVPSPPGRIVDGRVTLHLHDDGQEELVQVLELPAKGPEIRAIRGKQIGMIFQEPMTSLSPLHTIGNQITEALLIHDPDVTKAEARERAIDMLGRVGIPQASRLVDEYPYQLSGGMRQRAMIAMALICGPRLLIGDEPTTALDVTIEAQILELIKDIQSEYGMALMYISHDLTVVGDMADDIMVMYLGLVMERGSTQQIFDNPLHPYTIALWRSIPRISGKLERLQPIRGTLPNPYVSPSGCPFFERCQRCKGGVCDAELPPLQEVEPGHLVRCFGCT